MPDTSAPQSSDILLSYVTPHQHQIDWISTAPRPSETFSLGKKVLGKIWAGLLTGPNFIELLKHTILLKRKIHCLVKSDYRPRLHSNVMLSKQQLNTSHKQCIWHEVLTSNMCKISELFLCLSKFFA